MAFRVILDLNPPSLFILFNPRNNGLFPMFVCVSVTSELMNWLIQLALQVEASGIDIELRGGILKTPLKTCLGTILTRFFLHRKGWGIKIT